MRITIFSLGFSLLFMLFYFLIKQRSGKEQTTFAQTFAKAGAPDQMDHMDLAHLENNKMVSEGSQFGVQYFNEMMYD